LHNTIEFSMFETGPMCLFMFLAGAAIGVATPQDQNASEPGRDRSLGALAALTAASVAFCGTAVVAGKMLDAESWAHSGDEVYRTGRFADAAVSLTRAASESPVANSDYQYRRALVLISERNLPLQIREALETALYIDPTNVKAARTRGQFEIRQPHPDPAAFAAAYDRALALDPCDVQARVEYADGLVRLGQMDRAATEYRTALRLNDQYDITEPKRLSAQEVARIEKMLDVLR
jgi:tetratricopeptide (TPR) repeat protein